MLKIAIVDDERVALQYACVLLGEHNNIEVVACYSDPVQALAELGKNNEIDVVFLDIAMPEMTGLELAEHLYEKQPGIRVVFLTAYNRFAVEAFEVNAIDYLLKPINTERLNKTVARMQELVKLSKNAATVCVPDDKKDNERLKEFLPKSEINCLGKFAVVMNGEEMLWQSARVRELVALLAEKYRHGATGASIIEELWPESNAESGNTNLYTTIHRARKSLEPYRDFIQIVNKNKYYCLDIKNCYCELAEIEKLIEYRGDAAKISSVLAAKLHGWFSGSAYLEQECWEWSYVKKEQLEKELRSKSLI